MGNNRVIRGILRGYSMLVNSFVECPHVRACPKQILQDLEIHPPYRQFAAKVLLTLLLGYMRFKVLGFRA